jgi:putative photosynthetic complex assembly protein 2
MDLYVLPVLFTLFVWWFSTGVIVWLNRRRAVLRLWTMVGATAMAAAAIGGLWVSSRTTTVASAYCAFTCVILIWAWQEIGFLSGYVTGPRRTAATPAIAGWARAREAFATVMHHEFALLVLGGAVLAATWDQPNATGWWTFVVLWVMRQSAKLNLFLGVRNLYEGFLPPHLGYLHTYFRREPMNPLFPLSVLASTAVVVPLWLAAGRAADPATAAGLSLVGTLLALAILEHWFLVLPLPSENLWKWATRSSRASN